MADSDYTAPTIDAMQLTRLLEALIAGLVPPERAIEAWGIGHAIVVAVEAEALRQHRAGFESGGAPRAVHQEPLESPDDPEPEFETWAAVNTFQKFTQTHPNHVEPYGGWLCEFAKQHRAWERRQHDTAGEKRQAAKGWMRLMLEQFTAPKVIH